MKPTLLKEKTSLEIVTSNITRESHLKKDLRKGNSVLGMNSEQLAKKYGVKMDHLQYARNTTNIVRSNMKMILP